MKIDSLFARALGALFLLSLVISPMFAQSGIRPGGFHGLATWNERTIPGNPSGTKGQLELHITWNLGSQADLYEDIIKQFDSNFPHPAEVWTEIRLLPKGGAGLKEIIDALETPSGTISTADWKFRCFRDTNSDSTGEYFLEVVGLVDIPEKNDTSGKLNLFKVAEKRVHRRKLTTEEEKFVTYELGELFKGKAGFSKVVFN